MSDWSRLTIGEVVFSWRYEVPSFLTFVFQEKDIYIKREEIPVEPGEEDREYDPDELMIEEAGFRTTVADAKAVLDRYGYTRPFFAEVYASFRAGLNETAQEVLSDELGGRYPDWSSEQIDAEVRDHLSGSSDTPLGDLDAFTEFLRNGIEGDFKVDPFIDDVQLGVRGEYAVAPGTEMKPLPGFEVKLQNHAPLVKVGLLVAPGGFTKEVPTAIKRGSRDGYALALVARDDLDQLANGAESVLDWMERLLYRPI